MQQSLSIHKVSIYVLIGIAILASIALVAELLPEVKAKMIVIPTLVLIIGWTISFIISIVRSK
jgi:uncharacterized membrane protein